MRKNLLDDAANIGGHPFTIDDLQVLGYQGQDISEAFKMLAMHTSSNGADLLAGGTIAINNGTDYATNEGWIWYNNQLWKLQAKPTTLRPAGHLVYIEFNQTPIKPPKLYQNSTSKQIAVRNEAKLITAATPPANTVLFSALNRNNVFNTLNSIILSLQIADNRLDSIENEWQTASVAALINASISFNAASSYYRYKIIGKTIFVQAAIDLTTAVNNVRLKLPNSLQWKNENNPRVPCYAINSSTCEVRGDIVITSSEIIIGMGLTAVDGIVEINYMGELA
jgi:hypothetical protein